MSGLGGQQNGVDKMIRLAFGVPSLGLSLVFGTEVR
jgi:hypothetical protein